MSRSKYTHLFNILYKSLKVESSDDDSDVPSTSMTMHLEAECNAEKYPVVSNERATNKRKHEERKLPAHWYA